MSSVVTSQRAAISVASISFLSATLSRFSTLRSPSTSGRRVSSGASWRSRRWLSASSRATNSWAVMRRASSRGHALAQQRGQLGGERLLGDHALAALMPGLGLPGQRVRGEPEHGDVSRLGGAQDRFVIEARGQVEQDEARGSRDGGRDLPGGAGERERHARESGGLSNPSDEEQILDHRDYGRARSRHLLGLLLNAEGVALPFGQERERG